MKKVFANWKMSLSALLLVGGLMLVSNSAQAQGGQLVANPTSPEVKGAGVWVIESNALALLEAELTGSIAQALAQLPAGGQQYIVWKYKAQLYSSVHSSITEGASVPKAVVNNYAALAGPLDSVTFSALSQAEWQVMFNELVDLLTN